MCEGVEGKKPTAELGLTAILNEVWAQLVVQP